MAAYAAEVVRRYGNWVRPVTAGLFKLGQLGTRVMLGGLIVGILAQTMYGPVAAVVVVVLTGSALWAVWFRDADEMTTFGRLLERGAWLLRVQRKETTMRNGIWGRGGSSTNQLPGLAAQLRLHTARDGHGKSFVLIHAPRNGLYTVVLSATPTGGGDVDVERRDAWVANYGEFIRSLSDETGLEQCAVIMETAPDTSRKLERNVRRRMRADAPELSLQVMEQLLEGGARGAPTSRCFIACTFTAKIDGTERRRSASDVADEIALRLPALVSRLSVVGLGVASTVEAQELSELVRVAYDPAIAPLIDETKAAGVIPDLPWADIGPAAFETGWDDFAHDSGTSVSYLMTVPPPAGVDALKAGRLLQPHPSIVRKRVAFIYKPIDSGTSAKIAEADAHTARVRANRDTRSPSKAMIAAQAARTADEQAAGASLVNFAIAVTATVLDPEQLVTARRALEQQMGESRIRFRPAYGMQDAAFTLTLPLGIIPSKLSKISPRIRQEI